MLAYAIAFVVSISTPHTIPQPPLAVRQYKQELRERFPEPMVLRPL